MNDLTERDVALRASPRLSSGRLRNLAIVLAGILAGHSVLYGPSLIGQKILLPLDILAGPTFYMPAGGRD